MARFDELSSVAYQWLDLEEVASLCEFHGLNSAGHRVHEIYLQLSKVWKEVYFFELARKESSKDVAALQEKYGPFPTPTGVQNKDRETHADWHWGTIGLVRELDELAQSLLGTFDQPKGNCGDNTAIPVADGVAIEEVVATGKPPCSHSPDFRQVVWYGTEYSFTINQAIVVSNLWKAWENGTPEVGGETLLNAIDEQDPPKGIHLVFRNSPAWKAIICRGATKGSYRLVEPTTTAT